MNVSDSDLREIVCSVWSTQLSIELEEGLDIARDDPEWHREESMTGSIQITGDWSGAVLVQCALPMIRKAAAVMFMADEDKMERVDMRDALGELTNMTAGNIKAMLEGDNYISLPTVIEGKDYDLTVIDAEVIVFEAFALDGGKMAVTVLKTGA